MSLRFEWNDREARTNLRNPVLTSTGELREIIIAHSSRKRLLLMC